MTSKVKAYRRRLMTIISLCQLLGRENEQESAHRNTRMNRNITSRSEIPKMVRESTKNRKARKVNDISFKLGFGNRNFRLEGEH